MSEPDWSDRLDAAQARCDELASKLKPGAIARVFACCASEECGDYYADVSDLATGPNAPDAVAALEALEPMLREQADRLAAKEGGRQLGRVD